MLAKLAEDDRLDQLNAQKRRMKQLEHGRAVEKLIQDRRQQFVADKVRVFIFALGWSQRVSMRTLLLSEVTRLLLLGKGDRGLAEKCAGEAGFWFGLLTSAKCLLQANFFL